jgi:glycosyltransferase involved in cell wall biosynthesis
VTRVCMVVHNPCVHDSRVQREATTLAAAGYDVVVLARTAPGLALRERRDGWRLERLGAVTAPVEAAARSPSLAREMLRQEPSLHALAVRLVTTPDRLRFAVEVRERLLQLAPHVIHSHDLDTLGAAGVAATQLGARLVYDSHELWPEIDRGLPAPVRAVERAAYVALEQSFIQRADAVLVTSPGHADWLVQRYGIEAPEVLFNAPSKSTRGGGKLHVELGIDAPLVVHVGATTHGRGLELAVAAFAESALAGAHLVCMGPDSAGWRARLGEHAARLGVQDRLHFKDAVPHSEVVAWAASADAALVLLEARGPSYRLSLPNKLFECAFARVPIVATDQPVLGRIVRENRLGATIADGRPSTLARALAGVLERAPTADYDTFIEQYCWERQSERLVALYAKIA